jgi:plasmid stabilization system protein ParE
VIWLVSVRPRARADLREIRKWYEQQRAGLGDEFLDHAEDALTGLEQSAGRFRLYYRDYRCLLTTRFPYKIFFRIDGDEAIVFRVLHVARDHTRELPK